jgi:hypothetical protein
MLPLPFLLLANGRRLDLVRKIEQGADVGAYCTG